MPMYNSKAHRWQIMSNYDAGAPQLPASQKFTLYNFLEHAIKNGKIDFSDDIVEEMLIGEDGKMMNKKFKV